MGKSIYLSFFLGRSWLVWPHFRLRQLVARGGRRACSVSESVQGRTASADGPMRESRGEAYVALAAYHFVAVELGGQGFQRWLDDATSQAEDQVQSRLLWRQSVC